MNIELNFDKIKAEKQHPNETMVLKTRIGTAWQHYIEKTGINQTKLFISCEPNNLSQNEDSATSSAPNGKPTGISIEDRAKSYVSQDPIYSFDQLIVSESLRKMLILATKIISLEKQVFDDWGLRQIEPFPRSALNFYGEPGTGKTLAAHAIASKLGSKILLVSYAQIESMYHGEGPKNVEAVFYAAQRDKSVLFLDEADSLLSKRLTNVTQGSEQAINSMRSQLLLCLERFRGVVIFATNLIKNYDKAFETRVQNIHFPLPDRENRKKIWAVHFPSKLPLASDVNITELADIEGLCGREIKNAVIDASLQAALNNSNWVSKQDLIDSINKVINSRVHKDDNTLVHNLTAEEQQVFKEAI